MKKRKDNVMIDILHSILTDANTRDASTVEIQLAEQSAAGIPWLDEA